MRLRPPRSTLFPYTTLFRSEPYRSTTAWESRMPHSDTYRSHTIMILPGRNANSGELSNSTRSEEHTSELQSHSDVVCRLLLEKKNKYNHHPKLNQYTHHISN